MEKPKFTYEDFKTKISIQEVLQDAGYHLNRKDGIRYPSYVRLGNDGRKVSGDKFIVTANGMCCFQPPERKNYNVISFIKEHPHFFGDYKPGMSLDKLVNTVCYRLLKQPLEERQVRILDPIKDRKPFDAKKYKMVYDPHKVARFLIPRKITKRTQERFSKHIVIATKERKDGKEFSNIGFPLTIPGFNNIVGLEERGLPDKDGRSSYKGLAEGSNSREGMWIANLGGKNLSEVSKVLWFESAYDAMSYYQLKNYDPTIEEAVFVSTSGSPSQEQFKGMIAATPKAVHHLCFDRDKSGQMFAINFALTKKGGEFRTFLTPDDKLKVTTHDKGYEIDMKKFNFEEAAAKMNIASASPCPKEWKPYLNTLEDKTNVKSGNPEYLHGEAGQAYAEFKKCLQTLNTTITTKNVGAEELTRLFDGVQAARENYFAELTRVFPVWPPAEKTVIYEPCAPDFKDWNDQVRNIPAVTESPKAAIPSMEAADVKQGESQQTMGGLKR